MSLVSSVFPVVVVVAFVGCGSAPPDASEAEANSSIATVAAPIITNTNQCIRDLGGIQVCQSRNFLGLPNDLQGCCDGVRQLAVDRCECNPTLDVILGEEGTKIYDIEPVCRIVQASKWRKVVPRLLRSCRSLQTRNYGCEMTDMEVDAARLQTIFGFQSLFAGATKEEVCLDTPVFAANLAKVFAPNVNVNVPYGVGTYSGIADAAEYLGMTFSALNHGYWQNNTTPDRTKRARLEVSSAGNVWTTGGTTGGDFLRGRLPYTDLYLEQELKFEGCNTLISDETLHPNEGMRFLIERYVQAADLSKRWGLEDICRYHTRYCATDPTTRQYDSEAECLEYLGGLPLYTEACGQNRPLNGHSISCKFKHHFMIPANPKLHCPHIGRLGRADPNHHLKCDDASECGQDQGQSAWPPVQAIGASTPADVARAYQETNVGYETEPYGCAVPTEPREHHHQP